MVASDSFVVTETGPAIPRNLSAHNDRVLIVQRDGRLGFSELIQLDQASDGHLAHRIFTKMGDLSLPDGSDILAKGSPLSGVEVESKARSESPVRVEVVNVHHVRTQGQRINKVQAYKQCLADMGRVIHVPRAVVETNGVGDEIEGLLEMAGVAFERYKDDRWVAYEIDQPARPPGRDFSKHHATALMLLTAWPADEGSLVSRTRTEETMLRRSLIASLVGQGLAFETTWVPGYHPVECRLRLLDQEERRAFRAVTGAVAERVPVHRLVSADPGSLVVNLMLVPEAG